jgi:NAD(P)H dehydrogenase (quinone)
MNNAQPQQNSSKPVVLVTGATGQVGNYLVDAFDRGSGEIIVRLASRRQEQVDKWQAEGREAVVVDLDDPGTFPLALAGVDRLFVLTGYSVAMLAQCKTLVDAAVKAGVQHVVHQGAFTNWDVTDPHFAWHVMVERYIEGSGISWTHLHPNVFMELLSNMTPVSDGKFRIFWGDRRVGWIAARDIADVAATVLTDGPTKHAGKNYWLSTEVASGPEVAEILTDALGQDFQCEVLGPEEFKKTFTTGGVDVESWYADAAVEFTRQVIDGRMGYIGTVRDDVPFLTGRPATTLRQWAIENRDALSAVSAS